MRGCLGLVSYRVEEIARGVVLLRVNDRVTRFFESLWEIPEGITYNAYLVETREGYVLIDGWKSLYSGSLVGALESMIGPGELRYVIVNHLEPDHSGSLEDVLRWAPDARVLGSRFAARLLGSYPRARERFEAVADGEERVIGGRRFRFIYTPWLHWPETMVTWLEDEGVLFTCDVFGGFGVPEGVFDDQCAREADILRSMKKYLVTVIGKYRRFILRALEKLEGSGIRPRIIAPGHGLLWRESPERVIRYYRSLASAEPVRGKILIVYGSMYGTLEQLARSLACELRLAGLRPVVYGYTDTGRPNLSDVLADAIDAEKIVIAAPTYEAGVFPLLRFLVEEICEKAAAPKDVYILSTFGWGSIAARRLREALEACGFRVRRVVEEMSVSPHEGIAVRARVQELARELARSITGED